jgi:hypothetical protein
MRNGWKTANLALIGSIGLVAGCAGNGPLTSRQTTIGTLKTSNAHLEHEKSTLEREVAELKTENRRLEDRLVQEEDANGELLARLNDAQTAMRRQGIDGEPPARAADEPRTTPASRSPRKRKAPFAQIHGEIKAVPHPETESSSGDLDFTPSPPAVPPGFEPQGSLDRSLQWLPVANGASEPKVR